jgi:AcrR family transcriptional regulator
VSDGTASQAPVAPELTVRAAEIVAAARHLLETEGPEALTMRRLGDALGIRAPSIYKHLPGKHAVEVALIGDALTEIGHVLQQAVQPGTSGSITRLLTAYRDQALRHPNLYRLATNGPLPRDELADGLEDWAGHAFLAATGDPFVAQALWSFAHGMVILELDQRYPASSELDRTWQAGADAFTAAASMPTESPQMPTAWPTTGSSAISAGSVSRGASGGAGCSGAG